MSCLAQTSDFLPFPNLIPDFEFLKPVEHIVRASELVIYITTAIVMVAVDIVDQIHPDGKGHARHIPGS